MEDALSLFQFVKSNAAKGQFVDVVDFLVSLDYLNFSEQYQFLDTLRKDGYIIRYDNPLSPFTATSQSLLRNPNDEYKMMVKLTNRAEEYLRDNERTQREQKAVQDNLKLSRWAVRAAWVAAPVALILLIVNTFQFLDNRTKDVQISKRDSTITQLKSEISILVMQKDSLSSALKGKKSPPKKTSKPSPPKK
jgi:hypothetical protein